MSDHNSGTDLTQILLGKLIRTTKMIFAWFKEWSELGWNELGWSESGWNELGWSELGWSELGWSELGWLFLTKI